MSSDVLIRFDQVWKKYSRREIFHRSIREDALQIFSSGKIPGNKLKDEEFWVLSELQFQLSSGECVSLVGHNGSGKTTILKIISNVTQPTQGKALVKGQVAPLLEVGPGFHPDLTGRENIYMNGTILGMTLSELRNKEKAIAEYAEVDEFINTPVKKYSSGMLMRLGFSVAVHSSADIFLFDEIFSVADITFRERCNASIKQLTQAGKIVILVNHDRDNYGIHPTRVITLDHGRIVAE
jgi:ABC-type polysaccharide/polyol phosphate transport system ATPase subunit